MFSSERGARPHDIGLTDALAERTRQSFDGTVFRVTRLNADPTAFSTNGGRWAPPSTYLEVPTLYTSLDRDGAIAEVASYLAQLTPRPTKPIVAHRLRVTAQSVARLSSDDLAELGVDVTTYAARSYARPGEAPPSRTQEIGAALAFLGFDGLIVPSARWTCDNLILFGDNHHLSCELSPLEQEEVDWITWMTAVGFEGA